MLSNCIEKLHVIANLPKMAYCMTCEAYYDKTDDQLLAKKGVIKTEWTKGKIHFHRTILTNWLQAPYKSFWSNQF